jgi:hypothetical protein
MSLKLSRLKKWLTLEDSAKYLSLALGEPVETKDLIQLSLENNLALSILLPDRVMAVKYKHNPKAHEPEPPTQSRRDPFGLLDRLELMRRLSWALVLDEKTMYEPDFEDVRHVSGLWGLPCIERSNNITLLGSRLKSALTQSHISHEAKPGFGPIIIQNSDTDKFWGLVKLSSTAFDDDDSEHRPRSGDYAPIHELPKDTFIGVSQTELQRFIGALQEPDAITTGGQLESESEATELRRTQRTLAALAIGLAGKHGTYNNNNKPNVKALAETATGHLRDASGRTPHGFSDRTARDAITAALKACPDLLNDSNKAG